MYCGSKKQRIGAIEVVPILEFLKTDWWVKSLGSRGKTLDGLQGILDYEIRNLSQDQRKPVFIAGLVPYLILMHEFFEGYETPFRVDPVSIANLFVENQTTRERNVTMGQDFAKTYVAANQIAQLFGQTPTVEI